MKRLWLLSPTVTVLLAAWFVVATLKPQWLDRRDPMLSAVVPVFASPAVVSINTSKAPAQPPQQRPLVPLLLRRPGRTAAANRPGLGRDRQPGGLHPDQQPRDRRSRRDRGAAQRRPRRPPAKVIGTDPETDLAMLKIELTDLPVITLGNSDALAVGDQVLAIGNPFGVGQTVTSGIVSALGRTQLGINTFENFIQTDAAINPGNSGGALVDVKGHLMGINTAIYSRSGGSMGIGFAIPTSTARSVMEAIVRDGQVTRGWIGVEPQDLTPELAESFGSGWHRRA
jgi:serine protease DegQ